MHSDPEPLTKRARTTVEVNQMKADNSRTEPLLWSWPRRLDELAGNVHGTCLAVDDGQRHLSWRQLSERSKCVAAALRDLGLTATPKSAYPQSPGEIVIAQKPIILMMEHTVDAVAVLFGILRQGYPILPLSVLHSNRQQLLGRYADASTLFEAAAIISSSPLADELLIHRPTVPVISPESLLAWAGTIDDFQDVPTGLENVLAYIFTSGSTGNSKCVVATNRMAWAEMEWYPEIFQKLNVKVDPSTDRWRQDHEMGWWGAAYFGEVDVALAMQMAIVMMKPSDPNIAGRGVTMMGALPSQLQNLFPGAENSPETLRVIFSWAERCDVELGKKWKERGVKMADLLIASEYWLSLASCNLEVARASDGRSAHAMRAVAGATAMVLTDDFQPMDSGEEVTGLLGISGPQVSPGYAEKLVDGVTAIGTGPLTADAFRVVDGQWTMVPRDIVRRRADGSFTSLGRGGGMIKVQGGVLMATNVVELELQKGSIAAACITDPIHFEGGSSLFLEINWLSEWSLRECLRQASFLRMPIHFVRQMPRNQSTGKVQKALVQATMMEEQLTQSADMSELKATQRTQLAWYLKITYPVLVVALLQPKSIFSILTSLFQNDISNFVLAFCLLPVAFVEFLCIVAWTYTASAHASALGLHQTPWILLALVSIIALTDMSPTNVGVVSCLLCLLLFFSGFEAGKDSWLLLIQKKTGRFGCSLLMAWVMNSHPSQGTKAGFISGLFLVIASKRCLPPPSCPVNSAKFVIQRVFAYSWSCLETLRYVACIPVAFVLALPSLVLSLCAEFAWQHLNEPGKPIASRHSGESYEGPIEQLNDVTSYSYGQGNVWVDVEPGTYDVDMGETRIVHAETPAGLKAQALAKQAGVDFQGIDSLRIQRLSILLQKYLEPSMEFVELREACVDEETFVQLIDSRMTLKDDEEFVEPERQKPHPQDQLLSWLNGNAKIHREGATNAAWDCQVDVLMEWRGNNELDHAKLEEALQHVVKHHPMLRALKPPDLSTDAFMGNGCSEFSTLVAATWALIADVWSTHESWKSRSAETLRWLVSQALWWSWPRTVITNPDVNHYVKLHLLTAELDDEESKFIDEVHRCLATSWNDWWNQDAMLNICLINVSTKGSSRQFVYSSISHKYSDGGSAAALMQSLTDSYDALIRKERLPESESAVLELQQHRLWRYLTGQPAAPGIVDMYLFDVNNDTFYHDFGQSVSVDFSGPTCDLLRLVGLRADCSEEIAWLACIVSALCRMMPNEKAIKLLVVHNGRIGAAEGAVACVSQYIALEIPCTSDRKNIPLADIISRVKYNISHGRFRRPAPCEQFHARINIGGMIGACGEFVQVFKTRRSRPPSWSRATYIIQLRMDNEGGIWLVKDFKCHKLFDAATFWKVTVCAAQEIANGWFTKSLASHEA